MKKIKSIIICILITLSILTFTSCSRIDFDYSINFSVDGKIIATVGTDGDKISMPKNPEKADYTFDGWYWDEGEWNKPFTLNSILDQPIQENNNFTVYAKWVSAVNYTIIYNANGGSGVMDEQIATIDTAVSLNSVSFNAPYDKVFDKWNTKADGTGEYYADGEQVTNLCKAGETVTLYAQWHTREKFYYTVVFDANDGSGEKNSQKVEVDKSVTLSSFNFTGSFDVYFFEWNTKADGSGESYENRAEIENLAQPGETVTLYAQWRLWSYTVKYEANGGSGQMSDSKFSVGYASYLSMNLLRRDYYTFIGWNTKSDGTGVSYADRERVQDINGGEKTVTLYAQWKLNDGVTVVNNKDDVEKIRNNLDGVYLLNTDIDYLGNSFEPLSGTNQFTGTFEGNGHVIKNFNHAPSNPDFYKTASGFFGRIGSGGYVKNLSLCGFTVEGYSVGAFASISYGTIENCYASGEVVSKTYGFSGVVDAGGIVGTNHGFVENCMFAGKISVELTAGVVSAGGVTGLNISSTMNCLCVGSIEINLSGKGSCNPVSYVSYDYYQQGISTNNYYYSGMKIELYKDGVLTNCDKNSESKSASLSKLNSLSFYTETLLWDEAVWDLTELDFNNGKYPVLKQFKA